MKTPQLPSVGSLLQAKSFESLIDQWGRQAVVEGIQEVQIKIRGGKQTLEADDIEIQYTNLVERWLTNNYNHGYLSVFNLTGTLLHTNLGRALIHESIIAKASKSISQPVTLEYDLKFGKRGDREGILRERLRRLSGAEDATVVNNNAAALLLILHTFARQLKVVVSRGELVEIGGSFRLPEIMESAGCELLEVGTTNRTHLADYEQALKHSPALLLKVIPSNYRINGFSQTVATQELALVSKQADIPLVYDIGSGAMFDTATLGIEAEVTPRKALESGADLVTFSGDKLLGGPQAGIIVGRGDLIKQLNANPMKRALRLYKHTLSLLDETLKVYEDPDSIPKKIETIRLLSQSERTLRNRAEEVKSALTQVVPANIQINVQDSDAEIGSGTLPGTQLHSIAVVLTTNKQADLESLLKKLRQLPIPVIGRIHKQALYLDMHGAEPLKTLIKNLANLS